MLKTIWVSLLVVVAIGITGYLFRLTIMLQLASLAGAPPLVDKADVILGPNEHWVDDYYTVEQIGPDTYVIAEPRYHQDVHSYLLIGDERALLFDTGSPAGQIEPVVASLTDKPVSAIASHLHYDHVGSHGTFPTILMPDLPYLRARTIDGMFTPTPNEHLGFIEGCGIVTWKISGWWAPGTEMDLGGRKITLLSIPGHTPDSIALWDKESDQFFMGDYSDDGETYAFMPNSSLKAYLETTRTLTSTLPRTTRIYSAHAGVQTHGVPVAQYQSLVDLQNGLEAIVSGKSTASGFWPRSYRLNETTDLLVDWPGPFSTSNDLD